jgi:hypothetical protein
LHESDQRRPFVQRPGEEGRASDEDRRFVGAREAVEITHVLVKVAAATCGSKIKRVDDEDLGGAFSNSSFRVFDGVARRFAQVNVASSLRVRRHLRAQQGARAISCAKEHCPHVAPSQLRSQESCCHCFAGLGLAHEYSQPDWQECARTKNVD